MARAISVLLRPGGQPVFPDRCIVCQRESPGHTIAIAENEASLWGLIVPGLARIGLVKLRRFDLSICASCKPRIHLQRWGRVAGALAIIAVVLALIYPRLHGYSPLGRRVIAIGIVFLAIFPFTLYEAFAPRFFNVKISADHVLFDFLSDVYARNFVELNRPLVIASDLLEGSPGPNRAED